MGRIRSTLARAWTCAAYLALTLTAAHLLRTCTELLRAWGIPQHHYVLALHWLIIVFVLDAWVLMKDMDTLMLRNVVQNPSSWHEHYQELNKVDRRHAEEMLKLADMYNKAVNRIEGLEYVIRVIGKDQSQPTPERRPKRVQFTPRTPRHSLSL